MKLEFKIGDATKPGVSPFWLMHGCNNLGAWGAGFVLALNDTFGTDKNSPVDCYDRWFESSNTIPTLGDIQMVKVNKNDYVINMITQKGCGPLSIGKNETMIPFKYEAFTECLYRVRSNLKEYMQKTRNCPTLISPRIGCGLAMGDWEEVEKIIRGVFGDLGITWIVFDLPKKQASESFLTKWEKVIKAAA